MIIGLDASRANKKERTGTEWYSFELIRNLAKLDRTNRYYLYSKEKLRADLLNLGPNFISKVLNWPPKKLWSQLRLSGEMLFSPPEVLFVPAHTIPVIHPAKTVTTCHDIGFDRFPELYSKKELMYHRWSMRLAIKHAKKIITVSNFTKEEILKVYQVDPAKIEVIHNGFDDEFYHLIDNEAEINKVLEKFKIPKLFVLFIGRLEEKKNTPGLIKAWAILKHKYHVSHKLVLVGNPGYNFNEVLRSIQKNNLQREVILTGYLEAEVLPYLMNAADLFVFPSLYEGFGLPVLEAFACGTPVVASNSASLPEVAGEAAQLVDPKNIEEMAEAIFRVVNNKELQLEMKKRGFEQIKKFSWKLTAEKTLRVLEGV